MLKEAERDCLTYVPAITYDLKRKKILQCIPSLPSVALICPERYTIYISRAEFYHKQFNKLNNHGDLRFPRSYAKF